MDMSAMVGSIGLTLFCNRCVELFYEFGQDNAPAADLERLCKEAIVAFKSLKWPDPSSTEGEASALFNTNEEITSFTKFIASQTDEAQARETLDQLIESLENLLRNDITIDKKKEIASHLQEVFDELGDYSFYTTRDCLRAAASIGV